MAKVSAPLFSLEARGAVAKSLVYFPWKGINAVRKYVVPTNPKSDNQVTQRGYMTLAVAGIHVAMAAATNPIDSEDKSEYSFLGTLESTPRTWFNTISTQLLDTLP